MIVDQRGFTLVEVLIASAIVIAAMGVLMQLFASSLQQTQHVRQVSDELSVQRSVIAQLRDFNPAVADTGEGRVGSVHFSWRAKRFAPFLPDASAPEGGRLFAPFEVQVEIQLDGRNVKMNFVRLGWKAAE